MMQCLKELLIHKTKKKNKWLINFATSMKLYLHFSPSLQIDFVLNYFKYSFRYCSLLFAPHMHFEKFNNNFIIRIKLQANHKFKNNIILQANRKFKNNIIKIKTSRIKSY